MPTSRTNPRRRRLEQSGQGVLFETGAYGQVVPARAGAAEPRAQLPPGAPRPPKAVMLATDTRDAAHEEHRALQDATRDRDPLGLSERERQYYDVVRARGVGGRGVTTAEVGFELGLQVNRLTAACIALRERGLIVPAARRRCRASGHPAQPYRPAQ